MSTLPKRALIGGVIVPLVYLGAVGACAFWATDGSGSGTAPVGTTTDNLTIASPPVTWTPGSSAPVTVTLSNANGYFADTAANQDLFRGATITLTYASD